MGAEHVASESKDVAADAAGKQPLAFRFEICVIEAQEDRAEAEALAQQQAAAMRDVLAWIAEHSGRAAVPEPSDGEEASLASRDADSHGPDSHPGDDEPV
ncbi:hypothetical protein ACFOSC_20405 [Streptantibioticus rubrisoli]|uniref:Uncharacterized protein n=1 Tax=Streptantibioticus rubrisoli TaxID=1387313 RepID=A0ABT1PD02_9ACTN|nr:hypothetical protein [Streptantibioticus rubrisoli]MCQ4043257.1 hypothetical protein [Streptantibioticus rubrisoli]